MVSLKEYRESPENCSFVLKSGKGAAQPKPILRFKLGQVQEAIQDRQIQTGKDPLTKECIDEVRQEVANVLECFEIQHPPKLIDTAMIKIVEEVSEIPEEDIMQPKKKTKSKDGKGEYCFECSLQKEDCKLIESENKYKWVCRECLGI